MTANDRKFNYGDGVSLRDYVDEKFTDMRRAVDKAEHTMNNRLEGMNEFRAAMKDQASRMATREDVDQIRDRLSKLESIASVSAGKADQSSVNRANALALAGLAIGAISLIVRLI